jgi:hypothetical protein
MVNEDFFASEDEIARRRELAGEVLAALAAAGLAPRWARADEEIPGAQVSVDVSADESGGVYVTWEVGPNLLDAVLRHHAAGDRAAPETKLFEAVTLAMREAMLTILASSHFTVERCDDPTHHPPMIYVVGRAGTRTAGDE